MLQSIIASSVRNRLMVIALAALLLGLGQDRLAESTVEALPNFGPVRVEVQTEALGLSPEEVENLITNPMEQEFFTGIPWLHKIRSKSAPGLSAVEMEFTAGANDVRARQVVQERLTMVPALPAVSKPPYVIQPSASTNRLMILSMSSKDISLVDISTLARWKVRQRLLAVPGVSNVSVWGLRDRQLQVLIDPHRLRLAKVNVDEVIRTTANAMWSSPLTYVEASTPGTGGFIDTAHQRISINHTQPIKTAKELARIAIESDQPVPITLGEVADVVEGHQMLIGDSVVSGDAPGLLLVVERTPDSQISKVAADVDRAIDAMRPGMTGITIDTQVFRADAYVGSARSNLLASLGSGLVLATLAALVIFLSWRAALVSAVAVVVSLGVAWLVLSARGLTLNLPIIGGLVLALVVVIDDAIVAVASIRRPPVDPQTGSFTRLTAACHQAAGPIATTAVIVVLSVAPLWLLNNLAGDFLRPLATAYVTAVVASTGVALILTPALAAFLLKAPAGGATGANPPLASAYRKLLGSVQASPTVALAAGAVLVVAGAVCLPMLSTGNLLPALQDRDLVVRMSAEPGSSLPATRALVDKAMAAAKAIPGVRSVGAHLGRASTSDLVNSVDAADLWVSMKPDADYAGTLAAISAAMASQPGLKTEVSAYSNLRVRQMSDADNNELVVRVYGRNYQVLAAKAETVAKSIAEIAGVVAPRITPPVLEPTIEIEVDVDKASAKGVKPGDVRRGAAHIISGVTAGQMFEESKIIDVVVWGKAELRDSLESVKNTLVDGPGDSQVRVGDVAEVRVRPNPSVIPHDAVSRFIDVTARVNGRSIGAVAADAESKLKSINFPSEHHVEVMGEATARERLRREMLLYSMAAVVVLYFVLQARTQSWSLGLLAFLGLLVPLGGSAIGAWLAGDRLSTLSMMGALAVLAYAARGSLLFVERCRRIERETQTPPGAASAAQAADQGFAMVLASTSACALALLPLLFFGMSAGLEVLMPMALLLLGGLLGAALFNLLILPALYPRWAPVLADEPGAAAPQQPASAMP